MKAISMWQPWASLLVLGIKKYETRGKVYAIHREPILIQAALRLPMMQENISLAAEDLACKYLGVLWRLTVPRGAVVGQVHFSAAQHAESLRAFQTEEERELGGWGDGRLVYLANSRKLFRYPIPCKGAQAMPFAVPPEVLEAVQMEAA